jgi:hypothetical protein
LVIRQTGFPRLIDAEERERASRQRQILREIDHVIHAHLTIFIASEVMHDGRDSCQESYDEQNTQLRFYAKQRLAPPEISGSADNLTADSGVGTPFDSAYGAMDLAPAGD